MIRGTSLARTSIPPELVITAEAEDYLLAACAGDARLALNALEVAVRSTSLNQSGERVIEIHSQPLDDWVQVSIIDNGPGIPEDNLGKIFDPFFTTTDGTGLGLSVSYGIVRAHGGTIVAQNREEGGARFTLELPASQSPASGRRPEEHAT